jgi:hypothetical protein
MKMSMQYDYTIYFMNPRDNKLYQYIYDDFESANREYRQCTEAGYSATLLVSLKDYQRKLDTRITTIKGSC